MKRTRLARDAGLISAGGVAQSFLVRFPSLIARIGFVKAVSLRVSRRIVRTLRAGVAVERYGDLDACRTIFVAVPDGALEAVMRELAAEVSLERKMVVICESRLETAPWASLNILDFATRTLVVAGSKAAVRELAGIAKADGWRTIEIQSKAGYFAGVSSASDGLMAPLAAALEDFREAGFSRAEAARAVESLGWRTLRAGVRTGKWKVSRAV